MDDPQIPAGDLDTGRKVIVGIDGSVESRAALVWALRHTAHTGGDVHAVAVWHQPIQFGVAALPDPPAREFEAEARAWLAEALPDPPADRARVHTHIEQGDPTDVLLNHALDAELLVLGNHGRGALRGAHLGSVGLRCVNHAPCPVLLVPRPAPAQDRPAR